MAQQTPQIFGGVLANPSDAFTNVKGEIFEAAVINAAVLVNTDELVAQDAFLGSAGTPAKLFEGAALRNVADGGEILLQVPLGTSAYALSLPPAAPTGLQVLAADPSGNCSWVSGGGGSWSACFSGGAIAVSSIVLGNMNEGKTDAEWASAAAALGCGLLQEDLASGVVVGLQPGANTISDPPGAPGYALAPGTSYRTLVAPSAIIYKDLFFAGYYYGLDGYAFTSIIAYSSLVAANEAAAFASAPPTGVQGMAVVNEDVAGGGTNYDYTALAADAGGVPTALAGYRCFVRGGDLYQLLTTYPGAWLALPWYRTVYPE